MGQLAQDVPLGNGKKLHRGTYVAGHIAEVTSDPNGKRVKVQFDNIRLHGQWVPMVTNLRAIAGFMDVQSAYQPIEAPGEGTPYEWLPTTQIGGDTVYGLRGQVTSAEDPSKVVGKSVPYGVLAEPGANDEGRCRGAVDNDNRPQALWVFSSNACGVYGIAHLNVEHAGRTEPRGVIILASNNAKLSLRKGDGLLLRVH